VNDDLESQLRLYGEDIATRYSAAGVLGDDVRRRPGSRPRVALAIAAALFVLVVVGLGIWASASGDSKDRAAPISNTTVAPPGPEVVGLQVEYRGEVVGHIRPEDLTRIQHDSEGRALDPFYPDIGFSVYDDLEQLVGYATPDHGFVPLSEVDEFLSNPDAFPKQDGISNR